MMALGDLFPEAMEDPLLARRGISGIAADSRKVEPGFAFVAVPGTKANGIIFAADAAAKGAAAIVAEELPEASLGEAAFVRVADAHAALAAAAARWYTEQPKTIVAVTGTSGKTSVAAFVRQIWLALGHRAASLGTLGIIAPAGAAYGSLTTPDPIALHAALAQLAQEGVTHLAMEASSHGLAQKRLDGVRLVAGAFTNLSRDHLDYHATFEAYLAAKLRLFEALLPPGAAAVIHADTETAANVAAACASRGLRVFTTGRAGQDIRLLAAARDGLAMRLRLAHAGREHELTLPLPGDFQVANALVAAGLCIATGSEPASVLGALEKLEGVPGRLERVGSCRGASIFIDYAHKPDALENALRALRSLTEGRLIVLIGAGGDRDPGKRPMMGAVAAKGADCVIITDDNPRSENPAAIRAAIRAGAPGAMEIGDRGEAIRAAIGMLGQGDVLLIAGKGHETGQIVGNKTLPFSDHAAVRAALQGQAP